MAEQDESKYIGTALTRNKGRIRYFINKTWQIIPYDSDNCYPQRMEELKKNSGNATIATRRFAKQIKGLGFEDEALGSLVVNRKGMTMNKLLSLLADDYAVFFGWALHLPHNIRGTIFELKHIPFEQCRLGVPDDQDYVSKIVHYNDWGRYRSNQIKLKDISHLDKFTPSQEAADKQIALAIGEQGTILDYKGQMKYWTPVPDVYPECTFDPIRSTVKADGGIQDYQENNMYSSFMLNHIVEYPGKFPTKTERAEFVESLTKFTGPTGLKVMLLENDNLLADKDGGIKIHKFEIPRNDDLYSKTELSIQGRIRRMYNIPPVLYAESEPGQLGDNKKMEEAHIHYNHFTKPDREELSAAIEEIFTRTIWSGFSNFTILEIEFDGGQEPEPVIEPVIEPVVEPPEPDE